MTVNDAREYLGFTEIEGGEALLGQTPETTENKTEQEVDVNEEELGDQSPTDAGEDRG